MGFFWEKKFRKLFGDVQTAREFVWAEVCEEAPSLIGLFTKTET